jgi:outer membrane protein TolC
MRLLLLCALALSVCGCTRAFYRRWADRQTYGAIDERDHDPRWWDPHVSVIPPPASRLFDPFNPDRPPLPPDDPAAHRYMHRANGMRGYRYWHKNGDAPWIIDPNWRNFLPLDDNGVLVLTPERAVEQGLLHSREYQAAIQTVYLSALSLTLNRFEFYLHWLGTNDTNWTHFGSGPDESNLLTSNSLFGFTRAFAAGGQLLAEVANNITAQFAGPDTVAVTSNILVNFTQPLLRGFGRQVRMEALVENERTLLYAIREFARFRKSFTLNLFTSQYLSLLSQEQGIRNARANIESSEQSYRLNQALYELQAIGSVQVDQTYLQLQSARSVLIQAERGFQTSLDQYKLILGLPPGLPVRLDDSLLKPFELTDPAITELQKELEAFLAGYRLLDQAPALANLQEGFKKLMTYHARADKLVDEVEGELARWQKLLERPASDKEELARERSDWKQRVRDLEVLRDEFRALAKAVVRDERLLTPRSRDDGWRRLRARIGDENELVAKLFVLQTLVRVFLIQLEPVPYQEDEAFAYAFANRLDLMNERGRVVDAWRQVTITANALKGVLNVNFNANIATPPTGTNPFDFRASASQYTVGLHAEAPLNRMAERNAYRTAQINYQQERRTFIALRDQIQFDIRLDLRNLRADRVSFEIARRQLLSAARQLQGTREDLLIQGANASPAATLGVITALGNLLTAKNTLIGFWTQYETTRYKLLFDMELMQVDERGLYRNVNISASEPAAPAGAAPEPAEPTLPAPRVLPPLGPAVAPPRP